jgi:ABC-2 type transport system permease protein
MTTAFSAMVRNDIRLFFGNPKAVMMSILAPIAIASFFGYVFGSNNRGETSRIPIVIVDLDNSTISRAIAANLAVEKSLEVESSTLDVAREKIRKGKATAAISIPQGFVTAASDALFRGVNKPEIALLFDPSHAAEAGMVKGILMGSVMQAVTREATSGEAGRASIDQSLRALETARNLPSDEKRSLTDLLGSLQRWNTYNGNRRATGQGAVSTGMTIPFTTREEAVTSRQGVQYNGYAHAFAGMSVQFILFMGIDVGIGMLLLRQRGLWRRFRAAPLSRAVLLSSRAASAAIISIMILLVVFGFARVVFGVRAEGSLGGLLLIFAAFSLMTASFGLLIAALGNSPEAARGLSILATLLMVMLGGAWIPAFLFPPWLQKLTLFIPTRWAVDGLDAVTWRGLGISSALAPAAVLAGSAMLFGAIAVWRFRWEAD